MRRRLHRMFRWLHTFEPFELKDDFDGIVRVWYLGFRCSTCGDDGYSIPLGR